VAKLSERAGYAAALAVGVAIIALTIALSDPVAVAARIAGAQPWLIALSCLLDFASIAFFALAWTVTAMALGVRVGVVDGFVASVLGLVADKLVASASVSGELVRLAYVKSRRSDVGYAELLATLMVHRFLYNVAFVALLLIAISDLVSSGGLPHALVFVSALAALSTLAASYLLVRPESLKGVARAAARYSEKLLARFYGGGGLDLASRAEGFIDSVASSVRRAWRRKGLMALAAALMLLQWVAGALELGALFSSIGYSVNAWVLLVTFPLHCYLTALPVGIPAALGVTEAGTVALFVAFGVERSAAMAVTLLVRFVEVWFELALGAAVAVAAGVGQRERLLELARNWRVEARVLARGGGGGGKG
jgi:uncharacterized protein (TIRG00374 family)